MTDGRALFSDFGENVYLSDFVNNCIDRIAIEISKIEIVSVLKRENTIQRLNDDITRLFRFQPNELQTTKDFLACCEWLRRKDGHCFIYPQYTVVTDAKGNAYRKYTAFYPLNPTSIEIGMDDKETVWEIKFNWRDGSYDILPYGEIVHLKWRRGKNTIVGGGDDNGGPSTTDLLRSVKTLDAIMQGLPKSIEAALKMRAVYTVKGAIELDKIKKARDDFESHIYESKTGLVATDLSGELKPFDTKIPNIPTSAMSFLKAVLRERYGISEAVLGGDYNGDQHSAFYQNCIEDFIVEFEQAMSNVLFTRREQDVGHRIKCYYNKVAYLSTQNKIEIAKLATATGMMTLNEINDMFGAAPFADGNRRLQSLNYVNTELIDKYQLQKAGKENEPKDEPKE